MSKIPGINHLQAVKALEKTGFRIARQGKHIVMTNGVRILQFLATILSTPSRWAVSSEMRG
jgi:predicted RNA binding protein YcfA (HicA-like mRNA interferase family)